MKIVRLLWTVATILLQLQFTSGKRDKALFCSVCRAVVEEINYRIGEVDPNKKVKVGSYRVDPRGNQKLEEIQYATSDVHLTELFEDVCVHMKDYALVTNEQTKKRAVVRTKDRSGKALDTSNVRFSLELKETFKSYCEEVIEDHEEEMMSLFKQEDRTSIESELCGDLSGYCTEEELAEPVDQLPEQRPRPKISSFHKLEPGGSEMEPLNIDGTESMEDIRNRILEAAKTNPDQQGDDEADLDSDPFKDEL